MQTAMLADHAATVDRDDIALRERCCHCLQSPGIGSVGMGVLIYVILGLVLPQEQVTDVTSYEEDDVQVIDVSTSQV